MKTCFKCGETKPFDAFYKHPRMGDGYLGKCKECAKADVIANRHAKIEYYIDFDKKRAVLPHRVAARKAYAKTERGVQVRRAVCQRYKERHPDKYVAHFLFGNRMRSIRYAMARACEQCGSCTSIEAHHDDYGRPYEVRWLCKRHHVEWHKANTPKRGYAIDKDNYWIQDGDISIVKKGGNEIYHGLTALIPNSLIEVIARFSNSPLPF